MYFPSRRAASLIGIFLGFHRGHTRDTALGGLGGIHELMSLVDSILSLLFIVPVATADGFLHISLGSELSTYILLSWWHFLGHAGARLAVQNTDITQHCIP